jgi:hypothetical protein
MNRCAMVPPCGVAAVHGKRDANYEACARAAQAQDGGGDLVPASEATDRLAGNRVGDRELALRDHVGDHRRLDRAGADGIDADAARCVFQRCALGKAEDAVFGGVVGGAAGISDQAAQGRAVDDDAGALRTHLAQLMFHARPDAAQIDRGDTVEVLGWLVAGVG